MCTNICLSVSFCRPDLLLLDGKWIVEYTCTISLHTRAVLVLYLCFHHMLFVTLAKVLRSTIYNIVHA